MDAFARRRRALAQPLKKAKLDALLITNPVNVTYLTGFTGDSSAVIVAPKRTLLVSDGRFTQQIADECPGLETHIRPANRSILEAEAECLTKLELTNVGFESQTVTVADLDFLKEKSPTVNFAPERNRVEKLREIKDADEIAAIRHAVAVAERAFAMFRAMLRPTDNEKELIDAMEAYIRRAGGMRTAFDTIVGVGQRSALPHAPPTGVTVGESDFLLLDWGAVASLYHSDLTRVLSTAGLPGRVSARKKSPRVESRLRPVYTSVLRAQQRAIAMIRPGVAVRELDAAVRKSLAEDDLADYFTHGLGHGIGLQIHEGPQVRENSGAVLEAGMVITIEPGVYLPEWGGVRIEDDVLVTADGSEVLTSVPHDPDVVGWFGG